MESNKPKPQGKNRGCLIFIGVYLLCLIAMYFTTLPPEETKDFTDRVAKEFSIAGIVKTNSSQSQKYTAFSLESLN